MNFYYKPIDLPARFTRLLANSMGNITFTSSSV